uniref:Uncharacterized protein n=1 Tax=Alexandrium monilatum TaxID=311494 RepID=A0A6T0THY5_9DINO|mmetsp:Transcript_42063/g.125843  ORF Transcript_42063/g.125843 Transcript_42063/m.125843 type:complete len:120 (+) Transcript_42063:201-560(+)
MRSCSCGNAARRRASSGRTSSRKRNLSPSRPSKASRANTARPTKTRVQLQALKIPGGRTRDTLDCEYLLAECLGGQRQHQSAQALAESAWQGLEENLRRGPDHHVTLACQLLCARLLEA